MKMKKTRKLKARRQIGLYIDSKLHNAAANKCVNKEISLSKIIRILLSEWVHGDIEIKKTFKI